MPLLWIAFWGCVSSELPTSKASSEETTPASTEAEGAQDDEAVETGAAAGSDAAFRLGSNVAELHIERCVPVGYGYVCPIKVSSDEERLRGKGTLRACVGDGDLVPLLQEALLVGEAAPPLVLSVQWEPTDLVDGYCGFVELASGTFRITPVDG